MEAYGPDPGRARLSLTGSHWASGMEASGLVRPGIRLSLGPRYGSAYHSALIGPSPPQELVYPPGNPPGGMLPRGSPVREWRYSVSPSTDAAFFSDFLAAHAS
jgi:hypothetical protein